MTEFKQFRNELNNHICKIMNKSKYLYQVNVDKDLLWNTYLDSFPDGTNTIFRERREYDCSACRSFIKHFGNVVAIINNKPITIWDFETSIEIFKPVIKALSILINQSKINEIFLYNENRVGIPSNMEKTEVDIITWDHMYVDLLPQFVNRSNKSIGNIKGSFNNKKSVLKRSLEELTDESFEIILDLISQNSLYKGEEWEKVLKTFLKYKKEFNKIKSEDQEFYIWKLTGEIDDIVAKIRNHSIGTLLIDLSENLDVDQAVRKYESVVAPTNYKRPKAIFTKKMVEEAQKKLTDLGLIESLERRYATIDDITINNILFANKDVTRKMKNDVFDALATEAKVSKANYGKVEEISIYNFINEVLPRSENLSLFLESKHQSNLVSLIAPKNKKAPTLFKWNNAFSWAYNGNITDSMIRENVKNAGGCVDGVLRFSIQWNDGLDYNKNDFDAHCIEPNGNRIYYYKPENRSTLGNLDVDIINPIMNIPAIENITWPSKIKMQTGTYKFLVHNFSHHGGRRGFKAEIAFNGEIHSFSYDKELKQDQFISVAEVTLNKDGKFSIKPLLDSTTASIEMWNLKTNEFHPVSVLMYSPNYWDEQQGIGHRHYFFMLKNCLNESNPNGFFNEFLKNDLMEYKRVFEALGAKMKVQESENQLSGLGFSSTKRNEVIVKVESAVNRVLKVVF